MILVTGATGFIGHHLVHRLCTEGRPVRCLVHRAPPSSLPAAAEVVWADLADGRGLDEALAGVDTVIHLAGVTKALSADGYYAANRQASVTLAAALASRPVRLVHVSSLAASGPSLDGIPLTEDVEPHPVSIYGRSKLEGERMVRQIKPDAVIVRPPVVYGPRDTGVLALLKQFAGPLQVILAGGERWFSMIYVDDLVDGLLMAAFHPDAPGRTYFMAYPKPVSWSELANVASRIMSKHPRPIRVPVSLAYAIGYCADLWSRITRQPGIISRDKIVDARCSYWTCDTTRAARELAWQAHTSHEAGLATTLAWYKEAGWIRY